MRNSPNSRSPKKQSRYSSQRPVTSMATPRRPEPPNKMGLFGIVFIFGILGGLVWLFMLIFGMGPYESETSTKTPPINETVLFTLPPLITTRQFSTLMNTSTSTPAPTETLVPTETQTPTPELRPYILIGEMESMNSAIIPQQQLGCEWLIIAGQVWNLQGQEVAGLRLHLYGEVVGYTIDRYVDSGTALAYGESGYEIALENLVVDSEGSLFIQLENADGVPLSHPYAVQTFNDCDRNLILVNFKQVR